MVVGNDVGIAVLWLVDLEVGVVPGELLTWFDGLILLGELEVVRCLQHLNVLTEPLNGDGRVADHCWKRVWKKLFSGNIPVSKRRSTTVSKRKKFLFMFNVHTGTNITNFPEPELLEIGCQTA